MVDKIAVSCVEIQTERVICVFVRESMYVFVIKFMGAFHFCFFFACVGIKISNRKKKGKYPQIFRSRRTCVWLRGQDYGSVELRHLVKSNFFLTTSLNYNSA